MCKSYFLCFCRQCLEPMWVPRHFGWCVCGGQMGQRGLVRGKKRETQKISPGEVEMIRFLCNKKEMLAFVQTSTHPVSLKLRMQWAFQVKGRPGRRLRYVRQRTPCSKWVALCSNFYLQSPCLWVEPGIAVLLEICYKFDHILTFSLLVEFLPASALLSCS